MSYWRKYHCNKCNHEWTVDADVKYSYCKLCGHPDIKEINYGYESDD